MEKETFDYSMVPNNFSLCTEQDCPNADTCLRRIAYDHVPASITFLSILNPKANKEATRKKCQHYCSNEKVRYAKGFVRTTGVLTVNAASTFRYKLIATDDITRSEKGKLYSLPPNNYKSSHLPKSWAFIKKNTLIII